MSLEYLLLRCFGDELGGAHSGVRVALGSPPGKGADCGSGRCRKLVLDIHAAGSGASTDHCQPTEESEATGNEARHKLPQPLLLDALRAAVEPLELCLQTREVPVRYHLVLQRPFGYPRQLSCAALDRMPTILHTGVPIAPLVPDAELRRVTESCAQANLLGCAWFARKASTLGRLLDVSRAYPLPAAFHARAPVAPLAPLAVELLADVGARFLCMARLCLLQRAPARFAAVGAVLLNDALPKSLPSPTLRVARPPISPVPGHAVNGLAALAITGLLCHACLLFFHGTRAPPAVAKPLLLE
mmetsp:Transcript_55345/g.153347  ORF Transcript_55345/g.153347 Transcript_55345/m.153347 type:complete len:301 (-) Transcript_55345:348-1250(-)